MKKMPRGLFYILPFFAFWCVMGTVLLLDPLNLLWEEKLMFPVFCILLGSTAVVFGLFSPTHRKFYYLLTAILPVSMFLVCFFAFLFSKDGCSGKIQPYPPEALENAVGASFLLIYFGVMILGFVASFRKFRILK